MLLGKNLKRTKSKRPYTLK